MQMRIVTIILVFCLSGICGKNLPNGEKCYEAKTCVHSAQEKCGEDKNGNVRRFFDSCDIKEYNCLKNADFVKTSMVKCKDLPPIEDLILDKEASEDKDEEGPNNDEGHDQNEQNKDQSKGISDEKQNENTPKEDKNNNQNPYQEQGQSKDVEQEQNLEPDQGNDVEKDQSKGLEKDQGKDVEDDQGKDLDQGQNKELRNNFGHDNKKLVVRKKTHKKVIKKENKKA